MKNFYLIISAVFIALLIPFTKKVSNIQSEIQFITIGDGTAIERKYEYILMRYSNPITGEIPRDIRVLELEYARSLSYSTKEKDRNDKILRNNWQRRGPINFGGRTRAVALDIRNEDVVIAGGVSAGMWRSEDRGLNWQRTTALHQLSSVTCLTQDIREGKEDTWYYGTGEFFGNSASLRGNGIFKSTNNGLSWEPLESTITGSPVYWDNRFDFVWNIVTNHTNKEEDEVLVAFSLGGIARSTDGGLSWTTVLGGFGNAYSFCSDIAISPNGVYYAALSQFAPNNESSIKSGIFRSTDGVNWTDITPDFMPDKFNRIVIGIAPSDESIVYFSAETPGSGHRTYRRDGVEMWHSFWKYKYISGDGSGTNGLWQDRSSNLPYSGNDLREHFNTQQGYNFVLKVKPDNPDVVFIGATNLYRADDAFATKSNYKWIGGYGRSIPGMDYQEYPNHHPDVHTLFFSYTNPNILYTGSDGGVHRTNSCMDNNVVYEDLNKGYFTTQYYTIALDHKKGSPKIAGGLQDNTTLASFVDNINDEWVTITKGDGFYCAYEDGGKILYSSRNSMFQPKIRIYRTQFDDNNKIIHQRRIDPIGGSDFIWNTPIILDKNNQNIMYVAGGKVIWRNNDLSSIPFVNSTDSTNIGWDSLSHTYISDERVFITAIAVSKHPANVFYYGTSDGRVFRIDDAHIGNPVPIEITGSNFQDGYVSSIAIDPDDASEVLVSFSNYGIISIFRSVNRGGNWVPVAGNLEDNTNGTGNGPAVNWISILKLNERKVYLAGTSTGLYKTGYFDGEFTVWEPEAEDVIGNVPVDMIDLRLSDNYVAVGTHGTGVFTTYFKNVPDVPSKPELIAPQNAIGGMKNFVEFSWGEAKGAYSYVLELSLSPDFDVLFDLKKGIKTTKYELTIPSDTQIVYYWRVYAVNSMGIGNMSETRQFKTAPPAPLLLSPEQASKDNPLELDLEWTPVEGCTGYRIQLATSLSFGSGVLVDTVLSMSKFRASNLEANRRYYWRVASVDEWGEGVFSKTSNFFTGDFALVGELNLNFTLNKLYPNPVKESFNIELMQERDGLVSVWINSSVGKIYDCMYEGYLSQGINNLTLSVEGMPSGLYFVTVKCFNRQIVKPVLILR